MSGVSLSLLKRTERTPVLWDQGLLTSCNLQHLLKDPISEYRASAYELGVGNRPNVVPNSRNIGTTKGRGKQQQNPREGDFFQHGKGRRRRGKGVMSGRPSFTRTVWRRAGLLADTAIEALLEKP